MFLLSPSGGTESPGNLPKVTLARRGRATSFPPRQSGFRVCAPEHRPVLPCGAPAVVADIVWLWGEASGMEVGAEGQAMLAKPLRFSSEGVCKIVK